MTPSEYIKSLDNLINLLIEARDDIRATIRINEHLTNPVRVAIRNGVLTKITQASNDIEALELD